jgi:hypothetical protein
MLNDPCGTEQRKTAPVFSSGDVAKVVKADLTIMSPLSYLETFE